MQTQKQVAPGTQTVWSLDPIHSTVEFSIRNFILLTVQGRMAALEGTIVLDEVDIHRSSVEATIHADSIQTGIARRDAHLRAADFLDADKYPDIQFKSSNVGPGKDRDTLLIKGDLTIKGTSKPIALEVIQVDRSRSPLGEEVMYYVATAELDRFQFDIMYGRGVIGRMLRVTINVQATRPI